MISKLGRQHGQLGAVLAAMGAILLITIVPLWLSWTIIGIMLVLIGCYIMK